MRSVGAIAACVGLAAVVAGCNSLDAIYLREGIGTTLGTPDLPEASYLQDIYVGEICRQAGLRFSQQGDVLLCEEAGMRPAEWATFVQAGMNDIDRRCDAYLAWLDNKRRWREPILKQIHSTAAGTAAILGLTGVGPHAISIVGTAFGFAQETFFNFSSRLITEVDHSVVQLVVLDHQNQFRVKIANVPVDNRPMAIYLLRNYLRICMPFSIEMSINNTITTFHRSGPEALRTEPVLTRAPVVAARVAAATPRPPAVVFRESIPSSPRTPLPGVGGQPGPKPAPTVTGPDLTDVERKLPLFEGQRIQSNLCVSVADGNFGTETREAIRQSKIAARQSAQALTTPPPFDNTDGKIKSNLEVQKFADARDCSKDSSGVERGYLTAFEKFRFPGPVAISGLRSRLRACNRNLSLPDSELFDQPMRNAIMTVKASAPASEKAKFDDPNSGGLNNESYSYIVRTCVL
jgi:hypothetical protein